MSKYSGYPPATLTLAPDDMHVFDERLFRIVFAAALHALPWGTLREYGPVPDQRWDPHPSPAMEHPGCGVLYAATSIQGAIGEVFQKTRRVDVVSAAPVMLAWTPSRALELLDLGPGSRWLIRNRGAAALAHGPIEGCQQWAAAIHTHFPDLDGLWVPSTMYGTNAVLFQRSVGTFPSAPDAERPLRDPAMLKLVHAEAAQIGFPVDVPV